MNALFLTAMNRLPELNWFNVQSYVILLLSY